MNAKTCKQLRALARTRSVGKPERRLLAMKVQAGSGQRRYIAIVAVNDPDSTRGIYRHLKREHAKQIPRQESQS